jgi:hypothetical protein
MRLTNTGDVGIGTASPDAKLRVSGIFNGTQAIFTNTDGRGFLIGTASNGTNEAISVLNARGTGAGEFRLQTDGNDRVRISNIGNVMINTLTDNGVDKLQVSGSMNVSAKATAQTLSVTSNATVGGTLNVTGISTFSSRLNAVGGGIRLGAAGVSESLSVFLGGSTDAYPLVNNAYVTSGVGWRYLGNGPASIISYESGDFIYSNSPTNSSGPETFLPSITQRMRITAAGNMGIGSYTAPAAKLAVEGTALINTNTDNTVDKLQVNGSISGIGFKQAYVTKTGAYTATNDDYVIDCTSGTFTVTLPASSGRTGRILIIKNSGAGTITVDGNGAETIDGAATYSLAVQYATVQIMSDGTNWKIIAKF